MAYAIISLGGKQYRVQEGQRLLVDRVGHGEGKTFHPDVLFVGGDGRAEFAPKTQVTVKVLGETLGEKIRIGKYKRRTGYRRHTGHRAKLSQIEITSIGAKTAAAKPAAKTTAEKPKPAAEKKPAARKPAASAAAEKPKAPAKPRTRTAKPKTDEGAE
jgi:large subunit ribosomal protein L21